jgi:hypothetical protein
MDGSSKPIIHRAMKRTKPVSRNKRSPVADKIDEINTLTRAIAAPVPDREMNRLLDELFAATTALTHFPSQTVSDLDRKLDILCRRLREFLEPDDHAAVLTYLLAQNIREEVQVLSSVAE